jgi:hypothetical protein
MQQPPCAHPYVCHLPHAGQQQQRHVCRRLRVLVWSVSDTGQRRQRRCLRRKMVFCCVCAPPSTTSFPRSPLALPHYAYLGDTQCTSRRSGPAGRGLLPRQHVSTRQALGPHGGAAKAWEGSVKAGSSLNSRPAFPIIECLCALLVLAPPLFCPLPTTNGRCPRTAV